MSFSLTDKIPLPGFVAIAILNAENGLRRLSRGFPGRKLLLRAIDGVDGHHHAMTVGSLIQSEREGRALMLTIERLRAPRKPEQTGPMG